MVRTNTSQFNGALCLPPKKGCATKLYYPKASLGYKVFLLAYIQVNNFIYITYEHNHQFSLHTSGDPKIIII